MHGNFRTAAEMLNAYLHRLRWALSALPSEDREEILQETRAHFVERGEGAADPERVYVETAARFGAPEDYARRFLDNYRISIAVAEGSGFAMLPQALRLTGRGIVGFGGFVFFAMLYLLAVALVVVAIVKLVFPEHVGLWYAPEIGVYGMGFVDTYTATRTTERLGYWIIPLNVFLALLLYRITTTMLNRYLRSFLGSSMTPPI